MDRKIKFVRQCPYLGIVLDNTMPLIPLVNNAKKKVLNKIFLLRKFLTFEAAVAIYKKLILPVIDYAGFLLICCRLGDKGDLQNMQNDILRICFGTRISDRVSIEKLHKKCKILGLEQRMRKQILWLMYLLSREDNLFRVPTCETRNAAKIVFKVPHRITPKYDKSPYYIGTRKTNYIFGGSTHHI